MLWEYQTVANPSSLLVPYFPCIDRSRSTLTVKTVNIFFAPKDEKTGDETVMDSYARVNVTKYQDSNFSCQDMFL